MLFKPIYILTDYDRDNLNGQMLGLSHNTCLIEQYLEDIRYINHISWANLSSNKYAIHILDNYIECVDWYWISGNLNAISIIEKHLDKVNWIRLSNNPNAVHILEKNIDKVDWGILSGNPNAIHLLEANFDKINWSILSDNPNAIHLLETNFDKIDWYMLSGNPNAIHLLEANLDKVNWYKISGNPGAINILETNIEKLTKNKLYSNPNISMNFIEKYPIYIDNTDILFYDISPTFHDYIIQHIDKYKNAYYIKVLSTNQHAVRIFEKHTDSIFGNNSQEYIEPYFKYNPYLFHIFCKYDWAKMKKNNEALLEELCCYVFNPLRIQKLCDKFNISFIEYIESV